MNAYISSNCGCMSLYFKENREYNHPFIGMFFVNDIEWVKFCKYFQKYLRVEPIFGEPRKDSTWAIQNKSPWYKHSEVKTPYPVMYLGDVEIHWIHETSKEVVMEKYNRRRERFLTQNPKTYFLWSSADLMNDHTEKEYYDMVTIFSKIDGSLFLTKNLEDTHIHPLSIKWVDEWSTYSDERNSSHIPIFHDTVDRTKIWVDELSKIKPSLIGDRNKTKIHGKSSIVMPVTVSSPGWHFFKSFGLKSWERFLDIVDVDGFYIVCPIDDIEEIKSTVSHVDIPWVFVPESKISFGIDNRDGWFKQQIFKLTIAAIVKTQYYLVVDSDLFLTRPFSTDDMFHGNKFKYNSEKWQCINTSDFSQNSKWWHASCGLLDYPEHTLFDKEELMSVTPEILVVDYVKTLISYLYGKHGPDWQRVLCEEKFTEFTIYWLWLLKNNLTFSYTTDGFPLWVHDRTHNVLDYDTASVGNITNAFTDTKSHFSVFQSYLKMSPEPYINTINNFLMSYDTVFLVASTVTSNMHQHYTSEDRFNQTLETCESIRTHYPNSIIVLVEGSKLSERHLDKFKELFDVVLDTYKETSMYTNSISVKNGNIGHGETKLLEVGATYILDTLMRKYKFKKMFKLGARYRLNCMFTKDDWPSDKFTFRSHYDESVNTNVFTSGLYSVPVNKLSAYINYLKTIQAQLSTKYRMVEQAYKEIIPSEDTYIIDTLGLEGNLSYDGAFFVK